MCYPEPLRTRLGNGPGQFSNLGVCKEYSATMTYVEFLQAHSDRMIDGTIVTVYQFLLSTVVAIGVAILFGLMKLSKNLAVRSAFRSFISRYFRGTSLLVQLFWIFFVLPLFGINLDKFTAGFLAVGLNMGAYGAELVRGAILAVPQGQWEAAIALNMSSRKRMWRVVLPQAFVIMLPPWGNLIIEILKGTALVALISVTDLMFEVRQININTFQSIEAFGTAIIVYYVMARFFRDAGHARIRKPDVAKNREGIGYDCVAVGTGLGVGAEICRRDRQDVAGRRGRLRDRYLFSAWFSSWRNALQFVF